MYKLNEGNRHYNNQNYEEAIKCYNQTLTDNKTYILKSEILYNIGTSYLKLKQRDKSINYLKASCFCNNNLNAFYNIGFLYAVLDRFEESLSIFQIYIKYKPDDIDAIKAIREVREAITTRDMEDIEDEHRQRNRRISN